MKRFSSHCRNILLAATMSICGMASATNIFLDAATPGYTVALTLDAGTYDIKYLSGAWTAWTDVAGCNQAGESCSHGWMNSYVYSTSTSSHWYGDGIIYATAAQAEAGGMSHSASQFTLAQAATLAFSLPDNYYSDNSGTVTLSVTAVPEPEAYAMLLAGLGLMGLVARRRKNQA